jgi:adenine phosphoribosyltransferase
MTLRPASDAPVPFAAPTASRAPLSAWIRAIPDWPQPGVMFRDLTPLWADGAAWARAVDALAKPFDADPPEVVLGIEARGFVVGAALAARWKAGLLLARKPGKLPAATHREDYALEYGVTAIESHRDLVQPGRRVLIADDVLATGGTAFAAYAMARGLGLTPVGYAFLIEIRPLGGRERLGGALPVHAVIEYDGEGRPHEADA